MNAVLGGWRLSNILLVQSGAFVTPYFDGGDQAAPAPARSTAAINIPIACPASAPFINQAQARGSIPLRSPARHRKLDARHHVQHRRWLGAANPIGRWDPLLAGDIVGPARLQSLHRIVETFAITERVT